MQTEKRLRLQQEVMYRSRKLSRVNAVSREKDHPVKLLTKIFVF